MEAIPLWQLHNADLDAVLDDELWQTLDELQREGKVLHYGATIGPANGWITEGNARHRAARHRGAANHYNLLSSIRATRFSRRRASAKSV